MFGLIKNACFVGLTILSSENPLSTAPLNVTQLSATPLKCLSITNQECKVRPEIITKMCLPYFIKNINVKVFNLISRTNVTRHIEWHETCKCKSRLDASLSNDKERCNDDKCRCECKELIDKGICDKGSI